MIDIHNHLLFGIDDGSKSLENSIKALRDLASIGYTDIILTPHYIENTRFDSNVKNNKLILKELNKSLEKENININLYLGNEIFINYNILSLLKEGEITSLNNSKYLLIELPLSGEFEGYIEVFLELINHGYQVILAHPERYYTFQKDYEKIIELQEIGVLFQSNIESIIGSYGRGAKKLIKKLLKNRMITFLATDIHRAKNDYSKYDKAIRKINKYLTNDEYQKLVIKNPKKIVEQN